MGVFTADDPEGQTLTFQIIDPSNNFVVSNRILCYMWLIWKAKRIFARSLYYHYYKLKIYFAMVNLTGEKPYYQINHIYIMVKLIGLLCALYQCSWIMLLTMIHLHCDW